LLEQKFETIYPRLCPKVHSYLYNIDICGSENINLRTWKHKTKMEPKILIFCIFNNYVAAVTVSKLTEFDWTWINENTEYNVVIPPNDQFKDYKGSYSFCQDHGQNMLIIQRGEK